MKASKIGILLTFIVAASLLLVPINDDSSAADVMDDVVIFIYDEPIDLSAGDSDTVFISVTNGKSDPITARVVGPSEISKVTFSFSDTPVILDAGGLKIFEVVVHADAFAPTQSDVITFQVEIVWNGSSAVSSTDPITLNVSSSFSAGEDYNRILGVWESPWEDPLYATVISFVLWFIIAFIVSYILIPQILFIFVKEDKENRRAIRKSIWKPVSLMIMLFAFSSCARIYGVNEYTTATIGSIVGIFYILVGALIIWRIYKAAVASVFHRMSEKAGSIGIDDSLLPLFNMIGKILIAVTAFASILAALGFDLLMILTGAGILGLAISLGAQNTLSQFFNGLMLLITRPFKAGDQVMIGSSNAVMKVIRVGLMNTTFSDDGNNGVFVMPNSTVATSTINNITGTSRAYRIKMFVGIDYGADVALAKKLLFEAAYENPRVITDGSYDKPSVRLETFDASSINMSLSVYVEEFDDRGSIGGAIREALYMKFKENGVEIPFQRIDVHMR